MNKNFDISVQRKNSSNRGRRSKKTKTGQAAMTLYKQSRDYVMGEVTKRYGGPNGAVRGASDIMRIARMFNTENKYVDTLLDVTSTRSSPYCAALTSMAEGSDNNQRDGRSIRVIKFDANMKFYYSSGVPATATVQTQIFKYFLVRYNKTTAGSPTFAIADFLNVDFTTSRYTPISLPNTDRSEDFQILAMGQVDVPINYVTTVDTISYKLLTMTHECSFHQEFSGTGSSAICDNNVQLVIVATQEINAGGSSGCSFGIRMWYVDN